MQSDIKKVGILLVHGIGEQSQFKYLEATARNIITALAEIPKPPDKNRSTLVSVNTSSQAAFGAEQETWQAWDKAPVVVEVIDSKPDSHSSDVTQIHFHQVWWADLDEPDSLWTQIRFWIWGLSLWSIPGYFHPPQPGFKRMQLPTNIHEGQTSLTPGNRLRLFWVALVILLILPALSLLSYVLRRLLGIQLPRPDLFAQYIGDVKLYQQGERIGKGPLQDLGQPPRVTLRRRMIQGMVKMSLMPYERWYILAHSQGTVLAFNGLMETAQCLPNYLTDDLWLRCIDNPSKTGQDEPLIRLAQGVECLTEGEKKAMFPDHPSWRNKKYILDRKRLFKNCRGLLTYGSPLSKFASLWPPIVPINEDKDVFHKDFQWINIYDPTDPVAGETQPFRSRPDQPTHVSEPIDIAYKADSFHLISHTTYLNFSNSHRNALVDKIAEWIFSGHKLISESKDPTLSIEIGSSRWPNVTLKNMYSFSRRAIWIIAALLIGTLLSQLLLTTWPQFFRPVDLAIQDVIAITPIWVQWVIAAFYIPAITATVGALLGGARFLWIGLCAGSIGVIFLPIISLSPTISILSILNFSLRSILEGVSYISLAALIVAIVGMLVSLFVKARHKL